MNFMCLRSFQFRSIHHNIHHASEWVQTLFFLHTIETRHSSDQILCSTHNCLCCLKEPLTRCHRGLYYWQVRYWIAHSLNLRPLEGVLPSPEWFRKGSMRRQHYPLLSLVSHLILHYRR